MQNFPGAEYNLIVSRETQERLERFAKLFLKWSKSINLIAPSTIQQLWTRHIVDSLQLRNVIEISGRWIDLGSGGGFPGIVTAILLAENQEGWIDLVESNQKKCSFLRMALAETGGRGAVHPARIESAAKTLPAPDFISARALAELDQLFEYVQPWTTRKPDIKLIFHKGRDYRSEVDKARGGWDFDLVEHQSVVETDSVILEIASLMRRV
ncbi:16S rRNA (guanine(527)-N(7))-methyltransferase RsmG [Rhizobium sp. 'Codium 1']|uniref:16S rRNA (guanine(527)-N(7))-methyltransferase RsmG n=1 Tax=Rhizobium sp. 'Codium 1' TaxID=2940484 RepID=UPI001E2BA6C8|nr:16S rRNA (guanine(527)-N(7))-methyltransferase RsmG [Rhizobium sp. 'Codium 1']MCC8933218.1 16S rRNA (guanine(527)-N(7))-methyltransferase RsmG [Rhizobium sp. 'Codium 1']